MVKYNIALYAKFAAISKDPTMGRSHDNISYGLKSVNSGSHIIFYSINDDQIEIISILHERMEPRLHLTYD